MCDTFALMMNGQTYFAKNSDREPDEPQHVEWHEATDHTESKLTYITVDRQKKAHGIWLSRPQWMWGGEIGINEHGVCIGNEAVFTHLVLKKGHALLGMDLLRLALEESQSAIDALKCITMYLEKYGQGGAAGYKDKKFRYDNSFLIADANCVWKLETAGRLWVAKEYRHNEKQQTVAISNNLSIESDFDLCSNHLYEQAKALGYWNGNDIFSFKDCFSTWFIPWAGKADLRRSTNLQKLKNINDSENIQSQLAKILQSHFKGEKHSSNADVCMHAASILRPSGTTQSIIAKADGINSKIWATGSPTPCMSLYQPLDNKNSELIQSKEFWSRSYDIQASIKNNKDKIFKFNNINQHYQSKLWEAEQPDEIINKWWKELCQI